ncbi:MAG: putative hydrolase of the HAD superfamily [Parcubacteria group bacterium Licking1014_17]|nr:MAG: putative hydrolase of the HAD superfamily [Parcubacteria group bacterium Licking1014_17]
MGLKKINGIFIDIDDTLYSYAECDAAGRKAVFDYLSGKLNIPQKKIATAYNRARKKTHSNLKGLASSHSRFLYIQGCLEELTNLTPITIVMRAEAVFWKSFMDKIHLRPRILEFLRSIKKAGLKTVVITDLTARVQFEKISKLALDRFVDFVVTSEEAGGDKPSAAIFRVALKKCGLKPSQVVMVGDNRKRDVAGARKLGIRTIIINKELGFKKITLSGILAG